MQKIIGLILLITFLSQKNLFALETNKIKGQFKEEIESMLDFKSDRYKKVAHCNLYGICEWQSAAEFKRDDDLGTTHTKSSKIRHITRTQSDLIYDATYTFDEYGRRSTIISKPDNRNNFIVLFGCSFAYGNGLNDNETLHYNLGKELSNYYPYNYAIGGTGPNTMLALLQENRFKKEIRQKNGIFIYVLIHDHVHRAAGKLPSLMWLASSPYYEKVGDVLVRKGSFSTGRPWLTSFYLKLRSLYKYLYNYIRIFPPLVNSDFNNFCDLVTESKKEFLSQYPDSKFIVYIYPHTINLNPKISECFTKNNIDFLKGKPLPNRKDYYFPNDGHPNKRANKLVAKEISNYIRMNIKQ